MSTFDARDQPGRLASVAALALDIYLDAEKAQTFLDRPHAMLNGKVPRDVALASPADAVLNWAPPSTGDLSEDVRATADWLACEPLGARCGRLMEVPN